MSINVTVTGNPVSIKRGKMITTDPQMAKKEFDKRRLLRLEQVRQQSKELAEDVRNKVRKEKKKQMGQLEKDGKEKLKNWQNRKLLELHNQYLDALDEIGVGHKEAEELADESETLEQQRLLNEEIAKNRGRLAETKLQVEKNEENYKKAMPIQHKKLVRDIENTRATLVSSMRNEPKKTVRKCPRKVKKSTPAANINISIPNDSDFSEASSSSDSSKQLANIMEEDQAEESEGFCECLGSNCSEESDDSLEQVVEEPGLVHFEAKEQGNIGQKKHDPVTKSRVSSAPTPKQKSYKETIDDRRKLIEDFRSRPADTRISDRIKRRQLMASQPDYCDLVADSSPRPEVVIGSNRVREKISSRTGKYFDQTGEPSAKDPLELSADECACMRSHSSCPCRPKSAGATKPPYVIPADLAGGDRKSCKCGPRKQTIITNKPKTPAKEPIKSGEAKSTANKILEQQRLVNEEIAKNRGRLAETKLQVEKIEETFKKPMPIPHKKLARERPLRASSKLQAPPKEIPTKPQAPPKEILSKPQAPPKEIPTKPAIKLKDAATSKTETEAHSSQTGGVMPTKVRHYDFPNRFESDVPSSSNVERIRADSIEVIPHPSESEWYAKMKQRDIDAQVRGKRALEKEKIQKDYEEMMKKLPILQRKEHIAKIGIDKPEFHMSDERLKERERERQNRLENAYSKVIPDLRPQIVTIPSRRHEIPANDEPFEILDGGDSRILNLGKWDTDTKRKAMFSAEEVQEIIKAFTVQKPEDRKAKLKQLLKSLKLQKEQLINEIRALPPDDSVNALISDLTSFSDSDDKLDRKNGKSDKKRRLEGSGDSSDTSLQDKIKIKEKSRHKERPPKKIKKPSHKVRVLQNTSTQTTPKPTKEKSSSTTTTTTSSATNVQVYDHLEEEKNALPSGVQICTKTHTPCDCHKGKEGAPSEEVCKIYIKLNEEDAPKVEVVRSARDVPLDGVKDDGQRERQAKQTPKSPGKEPEIMKSKSPREEKRLKSPGKEIKAPKERTKPAVEKVSLATATEPHKKTKKSQPDITTKSSSSDKLPGTESWKEHLSKNSMSTSSTSYMSPPDFSKLYTTASSEGSKPSMYHLRKKPRQRNICRLPTLQLPPEEQDSNIMNYVKRLLSMSRTSVDELGVSSSDVQTPSQSVIEMESNNPLAAFQNIMRCINFRAADLARDLSVSGDTMQVPPNSSVTASTGGSGQAISTEKTKQALLSQYADVTDSCTERIANLAAMIEQLRQEKVQMMQSPPPLAPQQQQQQQQPVIGEDASEQVYRPQLPDGDRLTPPLSDKDYSTRYMDLPQLGEKSKGTNSTASLDEEELNKRLLEIDMSLAEKLKRFSQAKVDKPNKANAEDDDDDEAQLISDSQLEDTNQQFLDRLERLIQEGDEREQEQPLEQESPPPVPFVPFLVDIPKLPILEPQPEDGLEKRHPPPSKGLISAKKFNGNISLIPHELSTIVEADSQLSTRVSPNNSKTCTSPTKSKDKMIQPLLSPTVEELSLPSDKASAKPHQETKVALDASDSNKSFTCTEGTCPRLGSSSNLSSSSSGTDMKSIEDMLKSIGMDWAIPTLHKTKEALALSSSSSSGELSSKNKTSGKKSGSSNSEVSLKDFLKKQMISKISSSSLNRSDASPASFMRECSDISSIQAAGNSSTEKGKQRTSTPVMSTSKSTTSKTKEELQQQMFTGASDISSVKCNTSCEAPCKTSSGKPVVFRSLPGDDDSSLTKSSAE